MYVVCFTLDMFKTCNETTYLNHAKEKGGKRISAIESLQAFAG